VVEEGEGGEREWEERGRAEGDEGEGEGDKKGKRGGGTWGK